MKRKSTNILIAIMFCVGLSLLLYPTVSNFYNSWLQSKIITEYSAQVDNLDKEVYRKCLEEAEEWNEALWEDGNHFSLSEDMEAQYEDMLKISEDDVMGYIEIPSINLTLPIAHGAEEETLKNAVGHLEWSSLPIGGENTHCVLSAHRGLPSAELFTNIDHLERGDKFYIHVLGETLTYVVDKIAVVEPNDYTLLGKEEGKDYVTLFTCTPYGINSHRLLVRGVRAESINSENGTLIVRNEVTEIDLMYLIPASLAIVSIPVFLVSFWGNKQKKKRKGSDKNEKKE